MNLSKMKKILSATVSLMMAASALPLTTYAEGNNGWGNGSDRDWSGFAGGFETTGNENIGSDAGSGGNAQSGLNAKIKNDMPTKVPDGVEKSSMCKVENRSYYCKFTGKQKKCNVILPPNYDPNKKYPVMFVLHGIMGSENDMVSGMGVQELMTGLMTSGQAEEFIVVTPNMFTSKTMDGPSGFDQQTTSQYDNFVYDVTDSLLPFIKENYPIKEGRENTAVTGFSMGGLGDYADVDTDISKSQTDGEPSEHFINTVIKKIGAAFGFKNAITKGEVMDRYKDRAIRDCFWDAFYALLEALFNWDNQLVKEPTEIQECLEEFNQITSDLLISGKIGDLQTIDTNLLKSKGVNIMTDKEMQELIKSTAEETIKKAAEPNPDTDPAPQDPAPAEPVAKTYTQEEYDAGIKKAVEQSVAETAKQYQAAYGVSKQLDGGDGEQPVKKAVFAGLV